MAGSPSFHEARLLATPIRDLGLTITGTPLEPLLAQFATELQQRGICRLRPSFYLSTEWGVAFGTIAIAIPFYLARQDLLAVHAARVGHLEGANRLDLLRYLRHEMGHVVNYAYKLYEQECWIKHFGSITQPYEEEYRPQPFSRRFVRHLPGWYAQKHPDEDWAETFAVWLTPDINWRAAYGGWPEALAKLEYCDHVMTLVNARAPDVIAVEPDEDVRTITSSLEEYYHAEAGRQSEALPPGLDGALQAVFEDFATTDKSAARLPAMDWIDRHGQEVLANVYRWTGHFPERTRLLLQFLRERARQLEQFYPADRETDVGIALTALVTSLAMNHVLRGTYLP